MSGEPGSTPVNAPSRRLVVAARLLVVALSLVIGVIAFEIASRFILNPADYLAVSSIDDPILGMTIAPESPGWDRWGFRNREVPASADIVALGDSHTFGNTAKMNEAWPQVVARETGLTVYNMGLGGYGPNQYSYLLTARAAQLHPKQVLVGLYMGDDFENAFSITYGLDYWKFLRQGSRAPVNADIWGDPEPTGPLKPLRNWLSEHSFVYRLGVHGQVLRSVKASLQFRQITDDPSVIVIDAPDANIHEAFRPIRVAAGLDQDRPEVQEGMRITFQLLDEMNSNCRKMGCTLTVVIIPSKETVFASYFERAPQVQLLPLVQSLIRNERVATDSVHEHLRKNGIRYIDTVTALRSAVQNELYYRGPADMHPNANGYRVIGLAVAESLRASHTSATRN